MICLMIYVVAAQMKINVLDEFRIYSLYKNDEYIASGTMLEIADALGAKVQSILNYSSPAYNKMADRGKNKGANYRRLYLVQDYMFDGNYLKMLMQKHNLKSADVAEGAGLSLITIYNYTNNLVTYPQRKKVEQLAEFFNEEYKNFFTEVDML